MTKVSLLEELRAFTENAVNKLLLPVSFQKTDARPPKDRPAAVYLMRLPDSKAAEKKAPYILHQFVTGKDIQSPGSRPEASIVVRSVFCVYNKDEQEGGLALLNLMERVRIALLETPVLGGKFELDTEDGLESLAYTEDTAPYYVGEMISTWKLPAVQRLDVAKKLGGYYGR